MIRCVRIWTGADGESHFEEGAIDMGGGARGDFAEREDMGHEHFLSRNEVGWNFCLA
jgi:hypothetical protein